VRWFVSNCVASRLVKRVLFSFYLSQHVHTREGQVDKTQVWVGSMRTRRLETLVDFEAQVASTFLLLPLLDDGRWESKPSKFQPH
jgi:hypothetical protein